MHTKAWLCLLSSSYFLVTSFILWCIALPFKTKKELICRKEITVDLESHWEWKWFLLSKKFKMRKKCGIVSGKIPSLWFKYYVLSYLWHSFLHTFLAQSLLFEYTSGSVKFCFFHFFIELKKKIVSMRRRKK